jgi:hypothetical protein
VDFDNVARWVNGVQSRRSITRLLGGGALAASVAGLGLLTQEEAAGKKRKKPVCLCTATGCTGKKVKNRSKVIKKNPQCNYAGRCTTNPCAQACASSSECTGGQVCVGGQCADCTSYTQCETTTTVGHLACIQGRCRGNETCTSDAGCFVPLTCLEPPADGDQPDRCLLFSDCQVDDDCGNPAAPLCVLGNCVAPCGGALPACDPRFPCDGGVCLSTT